MQNPLQLPVLAVCLTLPDGSTLERAWTLEQNPPVKATTGGPPEWLDEPARRWPHPQDPITLTGKVQPGHEDDARAWIEGL